MESQWENGIWQRVRQSGPMGPQGAAALLREALALQRCYARLSPGSPWGKHLLKNQGQIIACLRGIRQLEGEGEIAAAAAGTDRCDRKACYHRTRQAMGEYAARGAAPETGLLYARLASLAEENCFMLACLLGSGG